MEQKSTEELEKILQGTHTCQVDTYLENNADSLLDTERPFSSYMRRMIKKAGKSQQQVFLAADIPERFGYKLLSEEKHTKQRDYILRICYAAGMTLEETQHALTLYGMGQLYARIPRDAVLMVAFNCRRGSVLEVNALLAAHGMEPLRTCGETA
ncbi:MAG: hypothetical protein LUJ09_02345 [Firmicutes bacterium]|nr:hypothetical protein [Bacillota bacterium]